MWQCKYRAETNQRSFRETSKEIMMKNGGTFEYLSPCNQCSVAALCYLQVLIVGVGRLVHVVETGRVNHVEFESGNVALALQETQRMGEKKEMLSH
jgi:hypothetical protein